MASLKERTNSPFWYIQFKDGQGKWKTKRTPYRRGVPQQDKEAQAHCAYQTASELSAKAANPSQKWDAWVPAFFATHICNPVTRNGYSQSWKWLRLYLAEVEVLVPAQLTFQHCFKYIEWRLDLTPENRTG